MTRFDVIMGKSNPKEQKNKLILVLDEGDEVLASIEKGMRENNVKEAEIGSVSGVVDSGIVSGDNGKQEFSECEAISASGKFKFGGDDLWGKMNIFLGTKKPLNGQLLKGIAKQDFEITLEY